nr:MAG TPA_asm: hypothetical protein [Caudoviricetes sp.]
MSPGFSLHSSSCRLFFLIDLFVCNTPSLTQQPC